MSIVLPKVGRPDIHTVRPKMRGSHFVENLPVSSNDKDIYSAVNEGETHSGANKVSENNTSKSPLRNVRFRVLVVTTARLQRITAWYTRLPRKAVYLTSHAGLFFRVCIVRHAREQNFVCRTLS